MKNLLYLLLLSVVFCQPLVPDKCNVFTDNAYHYDDNYVLDASIVKSAVFNVSASNDAHIALSDSYDVDTHLWPFTTYEIVLGGWGNSNSVIRKTLQGVAKVSYRGAILHHDVHGPTPTTFWISWANDTLLVGKGLVVGQNAVMRYSASGLTRSITKLNVATGWGSTGQWNFCVDPASTTTITPSSNSPAPVTTTSSPRPAPFLGLTKNLFKSSDCSGAPLEQTNLAPSDDQCFPDQDIGTLLSCTAHLATILQTSSCPLTDSNYVALTQIHLEACIPSPPYFTRYACPVFRSKLSIPDGIDSLQGKLSGYHTIYSSANCAESTESTTKYTWNPNCDSSTSPSVCGSNSVSNNYTYAVSGCAPLSDFYEEGKKSKSHHIGLIVGLVIGALAFVGIVGVGVWYYKKKFADKSKTSGDPMSHTADSVESYKLPDFNMLETPDT